MRKSLILSTLVLFLASCKVTESPEFLGVNNIKILDATVESLKVSADANFKNPNAIGGQLSTDNMKVFINDVETATIVTAPFDVPAKDLFTIPLTAQVPTDSIFSEKSIGGLITSLFSQTVRVQYKGDIKYKVLGFSHKYAVDQTDDIKIKF